MEEKCCTGQSLGGTDAVVTFSWGSGQERAQRCVACWLWRWGCVSCLLRLRLWKEEAGGHQRSPGDSEAIHGALAMSVIDR